MKGIEFIPSHTLSEKTKEKLKISAEKNKERLKKMQEEYNSGKYNNIINTL